MLDDLIFRVPEELERRAWVDRTTYRREYARSLADPEGFWAEQAERLEWFKRPARAGSRIIASLFATSR
jgi:acetyl-CoA synthetase